MKTWLGLILGVLFCSLGCSQGGPVDAVNNALTKPAEQMVAQESLEQLPEIEVAGGDWPWWRGPKGDGQVQEVTVPTEWSTDTNVVWQQQIVGEGHSSPILWGDQIFLTTADMKEQTQQLLCHDRNDGKMLWSLSLHQGGFMPMHDKNSQASATPACDGERVFAVFINSGALWVSATDREGKLLWQTNAGSFQSQHGYGSSPVLYKSFVIVNGDNPGGGFVAALHRKSGTVVWRVNRERSGSYATPIVATLAGKPQLLLSGQGAVTSYDPENGKLHWVCKGPADTTANTVGFDDLHVYASGGYPQKEILCVRADGSGDVSETHVVWRTGKGVAYEPSPVIHDGLAYFASSGVATCLDTKTGEEVWKKRLGGGVSSSFLLAGGHLYVTNEEGETFVFEPGREGKQIAKNSLGERVMATPAVGASHLYLRTRNHLYCLGTPTATTTRAAGNTLR